MAEHIIYLVLILLLIAATVTDLKERLIYDRFVVIGLMTAVVVRLFHRPEPWWNYLLTGLGVFIVLIIFAAFTDERSIGGGDVKLFAMIGLAVGWEPFLLIFLLSHVLAALYVLGWKLIQWKNVSGKSEFPFAPFILTATVLIYGLFWLW
ncbi:prepilin peptidase [Melghirimyces algeriensis]|uniref:Type IV leader peptidase family protein n=1 Tax=Melghirimyces algeriensis TaxID=910412 RepID=A0A521E9J1_9BACL|nr:A24 family peptidase [Melghirimyces algeriensis]SMO80574.1 Type IV leader peptidase family protein [Melghirimyces algeriensis]